jgi:hypothetical protein
LGIFSFWLLLPFGRLEELELPDFEAVRDEDIDLLLLAALLPVVLDWPPDLDWVLVAMLFGV